MAIALDKHVLADEAVAQHVDFALDFVGFWDDWSSDNITACRTGSRWSECIVNTYHLCAQSASTGLKWWTYSKCMFIQQYPEKGKGLECAGLNPHPNQTCTAAEYPAIVEAINNECATLAGLSGADIHECVTDGRGVALLKASNHKTVTFPKNANGYIEPQWVEVNGPDCEAVGYAGCGPSIDNTSCTDWEKCNPDAWATHIRSRVCGGGLCESNPSRLAIISA